MTDNSKYEQWYALSCFRGAEDKIVADLKNKIVSYKMQDTILDIRVFKRKEKIINPSGKSVIREIAIYPGYIFVKMIMTDEAWYIIRNTPKILSFVGSSGHGAKPIPLQDGEMKALIEGEVTKETTTVKAKTTGEKEIRSVYQIDADTGDPVEVIEGPFIGQKGKITGLDVNKGVAQVEIEFFGRLTVMEVGFSHIKKI